MKKLVTWLLDRKTHMEISIMKVICVCGLWLMFWLVKGIHKPSAKYVECVSMTEICIINQGSHRSLKVRKFESLDSRPVKSWNFSRGPWKSWNLDVYIYISNHKRTRIQSLHFFWNMGVSLRVKSLWIHWKGPWIWHWKVLESEMSKCVWTP